MIWNVGDYGYFSRYGITVFKIENVSDYEITIIMFPIDLDSSIPWGLEKTYVGDNRNNLPNKVDGEYKYQVVRMFFDYIFRN